MKHILLLFITMLTYTNIIAQGGPREKMKALKIGYITEQLNLSSKEAQEFWPIYNEYDHSMEQLKRKERSAIRSMKSTQNFETINEQEAATLITNYLGAENKKLELRKKLIQDLHKVISNKKTLKLIKAEMDFNRRLLKQLRHKKRGS